MLLGYCGQMFRLPFDEFTEFDNFWQYVERGNVKYLRTKGIGYSHLALSLTFSPETWASA